MYLGTILFSLVAASPLARPNTDTQVGPTSKPPLSQNEDKYRNLNQHTDVSSFPPLLLGPNFLQLAADWLRGYDKQKLSDGQLKLISNYLPNTLTEIYSHQGYGTVTYRCVDTQTLSRYPFYQHMEIGEAPNNATFDINSIGVGNFKHHDGSVTSIASVLNEIPSPINSTANSDWMAFAVKPVNIAPEGVFTGATYGYFDNVMGGVIPRSKCDGPGQLVSFNIIANYHLLK